MKDHSVDAIVTDPPYGLTQNKKGGSGEKSLNINSPAGRSRVTTGGGFMGQKWDAVVPGVEYWLEALRVLKPGGYLLAFGGTRTSHRLTCAIEDAGFEIRDCIMWLYGSGFPKSLDVSKAIDKAAGAEREVTGEMGKCGMKTAIPATDAAKQWQGWGTALKPAWEPIIVARKPLQGTVAENVQKYGTGALNIDACRIATDDTLSIGSNRRTNGVVNFGMRDDKEAQQQSNLGRWPANLILDEEAAALLDEQSGESISRIGKPRGSVNPGDGWGMTKTGAEYADNGGASRFFYTAKADKTDRGEGNNHPTVKPQDLIEYLIKLVSRPGAIILDPFSGSGTTALVADKMGRIGVGMDLELKYCKLGDRRCYDDAPLLANR